MHHLTMACWGFNLEIDDAVPVAHPLLPSTTPFLLGSTPFLTTRETIERLVTAVVVVVKASLPSQTKPSTPPTKHLVNGSNGQLLAWVIKLPHPHGKKQLKKGIYQRLHRNSQYIQ